ncbi:MAG: hypothetical protein ACKOF9_16405 [Burkholderiales bacterium]
MSRSVFDLATKRRVVDAVMATLKPGGSLFVGLAESLTGVRPQLKSVAPGVYLDRPQTASYREKTVEEC